MIREESTGNTLAQPHPPYHPAKQTQVSPTLLLSQHAILNWIAISQDFSF